MMQCTILLKFGTLVQYGSPEVAKVWKSTSGQIQDGGRRQYCTYLNCHNAAADRSILLKCGTQFKHVTTDIVQTFKITGSKVKVTAWCNKSAVKHYKSATDRLTDFMFRETHPRAERNTLCMYKVITGISSLCRRWIAVFLFLLSSYRYIINSFRILLSNRPKGHHLLNNSQQQIYIR